MANISSTIRQLFRVRAANTEWDPDRQSELWRALKRLPDGTVFSGMTAAWLLGIEGASPSTVEVIVPPDGRVTVKSGMLVSRARLGRAEITSARSLPCTAPLRTLLDVARLHELADAVVIADAALRQSVVGHEALARYIREHRGTHGIKPLRRVLELADSRAESPPETRLRLILVAAGLPRPDVQREIHDSEGRFIGRVDLYYETARLAIEYDGGYHRDTMTHDHRRQNVLLAAGFQLLRFTAPDLRDPAAVAGRVAGALRNSARIAI